MAPILKNFLSVALVTFALFFATNVAWAGGQPVPEWQCARELREAQAASSAQVCRIAGQSSWIPTGYSGWRREVCNIQCEIVTPPPIAVPVAQPVPNLPPQWLQAAVDLRAGTDAVERIAANTDEIRAMVEALTIKIDRIKVVRVSQASASRPSSSTSTSTARSSTSTSSPGPSASETAELRVAWAECQRMKNTMEASYVLYAPALAKCAWIGSELGVH